MQTKFMFWTCLNIYKSRIIKRSIKRFLGIQKGKKETLKSIYSLLKWTDTFQDQNLKEIKNMLEKYDDKVVWLTSKKAVKKVMRSVCLGGDCYE